MLQKRSQLDFGRFVDESNQFAPNDTFLQGLGLTSALAPTPDTLVAVEMDGLLAEVVHTNEERGRFRELLLRRISPYLKDPEATELSMLDLATTGAVDPEKIKTFLLRHGVDVTRIGDLDYARRVFREAIDYFNTEVQPRVPFNATLGKIQDPERPGSHYDDPSDIYQIFITAAGKGRKILVPQACALLRIAAVVDYMNRDPKLSLLPVAQGAIERFEANHIKMRNVSGQKSLTYVGGSKREIEIPLVAFQKRPKDKHGTIRKLLLKPSNRSEEVLDRFGFRATTHTAADTLRLIYHLFCNPSGAVLPAMNIRIKETMNRLLDRDRLVSLMANPPAAAAFIHAVGTSTVVDDISLMSNGHQDDHNASTAARYKALHITFDMPLETPDGERRSLSVEGQFLDKGSRDTNSQVASHEEYRERQLDAIRNRILGNNLLTNFNDRSR